MAAAGVVAQLDGGAGKALLINDLLGLLGVVLGELPAAALLVDDRREDVVSRLAAALEEGVDDVLAVDGQGHGVTQVLVGHGLVLEVDSEEIDRGLGAEKGLAARGDGVAVNGLAELLAQLLDTAGRDLAEVHVAGLKLAVGGLGVLLDGEVDGVEGGLVAIVVLEALDVDVLAGLPLAVHHEGAVADGGQQEAVGVVDGGLRHGGKARVAADGQEVGHGGGQGHDEGLVVRAGEAGDLLGATLGHLVIAHDGRQVVADLTRGGHGGVDQTLPAALEGLGGHGVAVVELGVLEVEGEDGVVVVDLPGLGSLGLDVGLVPVPLHQGVKQDVADLGALGLLKIVGVDGHRVGDVVLEGAAVRSLDGGLALAGRGVAVLAAGREGGEGAGSQTALDEGAASDAATVPVERHRSSSSCCLRGGQPVCPIPRSCLVRGQTPG